MKKWAFVSDFDGTITERDFYWMVIDHFYPQGKQLYQDWKKGEIKDIDFLRNVFQSINQEEERVHHLIKEIPIDSTVFPFIEQVQDQGGDFFILSAGANYYIDYLLKSYQIEKVKVFANHSYFKGNNLHFQIEEDTPFYSERYGIDKLKVIQKLKEDYDEIYFIGDSEPDSHPALAADVTFAKGALQTLLREKEIPFHPVHSFYDVARYMREQKILK